MNSGKPDKTETLLTSVAETIGSTLGTVARKADAVQKAVLHPSREERSRPKRTTPPRRARAASKNRNARRKSATTQASRRRRKAGRPRRSPRR